MDDLQKVLGATFGAEPVTKAIRSYGELHKSQRDNKALQYSSAVGGGLGIVSSVGSRVAPSHNYFGGEGGR